MKHNMLINFQRIMVIIRYDIINNDNIKILDILKTMLENKGSNNELIMHLCNINFVKEMNVTFLYDTCNDNYYIQYEESMDKFLLHSINLIERFIYQGKYELAYEIVDAIHVFPELFLEGNKGNLKEYWKIFIAPIQKKCKDNLFFEFRDFFYTNTK